MSNGVQWHHDRRFMIRNLRNFGMGKSYLEQAIDSEAQALVEDLKKYAEEPITYPDSFRTAPLNVIWQMMASECGGVGVGGGNNCVVYLNIGLLQSYFLT